MRKLLLNTSAIATVAVLTANVAVADVSISAETEWTYMSRSSNVTANDGTSFGTDSEITFSFTNKTDNGLDIGYVVELESDATTAGGADNMVDESSLSISGGFGKIVLGMNDAAADDYAISADDIVSADEAPTSSSATIALTTDIELGDGDNNKIAYHLPAMGGFTAGVSFTDSGAVGSTDTTTFGMNYVIEAAGNTVTIGAATATTEATTTDTDSQILGVKVDSGNLSLIASQTSYEAVDEDISTTGIGVSYKLSNGVVLGAYTLKSEDDLDAGEEYSKSGVEVQYAIASGLTAYLNVEDYDYKIGTNNDSADTVADAGTVSKLTIAASF